MKVEYKPWEKLEIKALTLYANAEEFMQTATDNIPSNAAGVAACFWGNGVLFRFQALGGGQGSEALTQRFLDGELVWEGVEAAPMPKFEKEVHLPEKPMLAFRVQDVSRNSLFGPVTNWLQMQLVATSLARKSRGGK
ncbi:MAG: hypothetical protein WBG19_06685 [Thermoplasmata archaeon]